MNDHVALPRKVREAGEQADKDLKALQDKSKADETGSQDEPGKTEFDADGKPKQPAPLDGGTPGKENKTGIDWQAEHAILLQKNKVLQGKYNAEVPILHQEVKDLKIETQQLRSNIEQSDSPALPGADGIPAATVEVPETVSSMYGEDLIKFVVDSARAAAAGAVKPIADRVDSVTEENENTRKNTFFTRLSEAHSDWEQINQTEAWLRFLTEVLPDMGVERQWVINNAIASGNPEPIILQLTEFKKRTGGEGEQARLARQETPSGDGKPVTDPGVNNEVQAINESDISQFYTDVALGKYEGREKEVAQLEKQVQAAGLAGKIVMDVSGGKQPVF